MTHTAPTEGDVRGVALVPLAGPWIEMAMLLPDPAAQTLLLADGIAQATSFAMMLAGALGRRRVPVRRPLYFHLVPIAAGGAIAGTF